MAEMIVSIEKLSKSYGDFKAVNDLSISVSRGEVFGLLGPNGAGKTTTLECLEGMRKADSGALIVAGCDPQKDKTLLRNELGVQLQSSSLPDSIRVGEALELVAAWHDCPPYAGLIARYNLGSLLRKQYKELSTGQKRRLHLVLALVHAPKVLILDEPTAGLDVQSRAQLHEEIRALKSEGITIILATHDMAEAETLCDRIAIIMNGQLIACGTPEEVTAKGSKDTRIRLRTQKDSLLPGKDMGGAVFVKEKDGYLEWNCRDVAVAVSQILNEVQASGDSVEDLRVERPTLEERFLELIEEGARI